MIQVQENIQKDSRTEEWTGPISWDPSGYCQASNKFNCTVEVKSIEYDVFCYIHKLLHVVQHVKNQLN